VAICLERNVAVQTIKSIARGPWATSDRTHTTWYQPLEDQADIDRAVHYVLGVPGIFLNTVGDLRLLPKVLDAASRFERRPTDAGGAARGVGTRAPSLWGLPPGAGPADAPFHDRRGRRDRRALSRARARPPRACRGRARARSQARDGRRRNHHESKRHGRAR